MSSTAQTHILAIDDDPAMRKLVADYLRENNLRVTAVATGAEMAQALDQHAIDLVVLDLRLAAEDGMQLARKLREQSTVPIIIVTGKQEEADRVMGLELGADDYVTKPFSPRELLARIRAVLRRYQTAREVLPAQGEKRRAATRALARAAARSLAAVRRRGLRSLDRRAGPQAAAQDRDEPGAAAIHQDRTRRRLRVQRGGRSPTLRAQRRHPPSGRF